MSTGKSTITEALARRYRTTYASEYGRDYWTEHQVDRRIGLEAFDEIAVGHMEREERALLQADKYLFVDTNAITTYMFALDYHGRAPERLTRIALENAQRYDLFSCVTTIFLTRIHGIAAGIRSGIFSISKLLRI